MASFVARLAMSGIDVAVHDPQVTQVGFEAEMMTQGHQELLEEDQDGDIENMGSNNRA